MQEDENGLTKKSSTIGTREVPEVNMNNYFDPFIMLRPASIIIMVIAALIYNHYKKER